MDAEKSHKYASNVSAPILTEKIIEDLKMMPDGIGSLDAIRAEKRKNIDAREQQVFLRFSFSSNRAPLPTNRSHHQ